MGEKIGKIGGNIDVSTIMENKLTESSTEANGLGFEGYFKRVRPGGTWDLKNNKNTIWGIAWKTDKDNKTKTTFSFDSYSGMSAADVGNYHAGYTGRFTQMLRYTLLKGAGAAETYKDFSNGRWGDGFSRLGELLNPFNERSGDREADYRWNTRGMNDASLDIMIKLYNKK
jgi:hypothetical protein